MIKLSDSNGKVFPKLLYQNGKVKSAVIGEHCWVDFSIPMSDDVEEGIESEMTVEEFNDLCIEQNLSYGTPIAVCTEADLRHPEVVETVLRKLK